MPNAPKYIPDKECVNCGNSIPWRPGRKARERATYCAEACRRQRAASSGTCIECGALIPWREGRTIRVRSRFCGNECKHAWQRRPENAPNYRGARADRPCEVCGAEFSFYPSVRPGAKYCSRKCKGIGHSALMTGRRPKNGVYANAVVFRQMMRREFHDRCAVCGWDEAPCDVCHIEARKNGGADHLDNVVMLCPNHHRLFDLGRIPVEEVRAARDAILR